MLDETVHALGERLGKNLYSCCLYGSAVRGNLVEGFSDLNLLLVLDRSTPESHHQIASILESAPTIEPFILGWPGFERSARAFATKFASIRRNYRVLLGADPFVNFHVDPKVDRFLCEQAIRNLRLRLVHAFVTRGRNPGYQRFVLRNLPGLFVNLSEVLRLQQISLPTPFEERIPILERELGLEGETLRALLDLQRTPGAWSDAETTDLHSRLFQLLDRGVAWIETHWQAE